MGILLQVRPAMQRTGSARKRLAARGSTAGVWTKTWNGVVMVVQVRNLALGVELLKQLEQVRAGAAHTIQEMVKLDPLRVGNRGSHRYCFANAFNHFGHMADWALLIDPPPVLAVLEAIYGSPNFRLQGIGGDFVLP